jgi:hypothetical protein
MKLIVNEKCLDECLSCEFPSIDIIEIIVNEGIIISKTHLECMIINNVNISKKCNASDNDIYNACHMYKIATTKLLSPIMQKSKQYKLHKMVLNKTKKTTFKLISAFMEKEKIELNSYCYDDILITHHTYALFDNVHVTNENKLFNDALCGAIKNKKYTVTLEAISRCIDLTKRMKLLKYYEFVKN